MFRYVLVYFFMCNTAISQELPCSGDIQSKWVINDPVQFQAFSEAIKCTGEFDVEWNGRFIVDKTIQVSGGTVLNVTGADTNGNTFIDGGNSVQIFSVVNSELNLKDITLMNGNGTDGGAISAKSSKLSLVNTRFVSNNGQNGGAMYISNKSTVYCSGSSFTNNTASYGGGMFMEEMSEASCGGSWTGNSAVQYGGAVSISKSSLEWKKETIFESNIAGDFGGAVFSFNDSTVSWNTNVIFYLNEAFIGGAMCIFESSFSGDGTTSFYSNRGNIGGGVGTRNSNIYMGGQTVFRHNSADEGGAIFSLNTTVRFSGYSLFEFNNANFGGGLDMDESTLSWEGQFEMIGNNGFDFAGAINSRNSTVSCSESITTFVDNYGRLSGGAIRVDSSNISLRGVTTFFKNEVNESDHGVGGALDIIDSIVYWEGVMGIYNNTGTAIDVFSSELSWKGNTTFKHNVQGNSLGNVLYVQKSNVSWGEGYTKFVENSGNGSTIDIFNSELSWSGYTEFVDNVAYFVEEFGGGGGGALSLDNTTVSWSGPTIFSGNTAFLSGAIDIRSSSNVSWSGPTEFVGNSADVSGGSISITKGNLSWTGDTKFTSNTAGFGGAVYSSGQSLGDVNIYIYGKTVFENNTAPAGLGGALYFFGDISMEIDRFISPIFVGNKASVSGGAIYLIGNGNGESPVFVFTNVTFENNESGNGGGIDSFGKKMVFEDCRFVLNKASSLGGAMNSVGGTDTFVRTVFYGNSGGTGGALRLAGTTSIDDCHFVENISDEGEGTAISNIGVVNIRGNNTFSGNTYNCENSMYLDYMEVDNPFEAICDGCEIECTNCVFSEGTVEPVCFIVLDHSKSIGGQTTLEDISIEDGFWRATTTSKEILQCHNEDACLGGVTGSEGYCEVGYEGPYCSICSEGYSESLSFSCRKCSEDSSDAILTSLIVSFVGLGSICILVSYLTSSDISESKKGLIGLFKTYIPLQSLKILVVTWQILTQFSAVANVTYPDIYQKFLDGLDVFNFDFSWILSAGCVMDIDFHDKLIVVTVTPILALAFLACTYMASYWKNCGNDEVLVKIHNRHVSMVLLLTFLVYSNVSSVLFKAFSCEHLDDGKYYVRSDYSIQCDSSKHVGIQVYAGVMIVVYTIGIPVFYGWLLFRDMDVLKVPESDRVYYYSRVVAISDLWQSYRPNVFYYEIVECLRRIILSSVVVFIYPNTSAQVAITLLLSFIFVMVYEVMRPYVSKWDTWMSRIGQIVVFVSMYLALLLKVDVSGERYESQKIFEGVLVFANSIMIVVVIAEAIATMLYLKSEKDEPKEDLNPMFRMFSIFSVRSNSNV